MQTLPNSPLPWLLRVSDCGNKNRLINPFANEIIKPLPRPLHVNLSQFRISKIFRSYSVRHVNLVDFECSTNDFEQGCGTRFEKVVFLSDTNSDDDHAVVVALQSPGRIIRGYLVAIELRDDEFMVIAYSRVNHFLEVIHFDGRVYAVDIYGNGYTVDSSLNITLIAPQLDGQIPWKKNLLECSGELIMVDRFLGDEMDSSLRVYKLDEEEHKWVELTNLGDKILFVGKDCCFSVSGTDFDGCACRGNCIFFVNDYYTRFKMKGNDPYDALKLSDMMVIEVFNLEDGRVGPLVRFPGYADLFWPPPSWINPISSSSINP